MWGSHEIRPGGPIKGKTESKNPLPPPVLLPVFRFVCIPEGQRKVQSDIAKPMYYGPQMADDLAHIQCVIIYVMLSSQCVTLFLSSLLPHRVLAYALHLGYE